MELPQTNVAAGHTGRWIGVRHVIAAGHRIPAGNRARRRTRSHSRPGVVLAGHRVADASCGRRRPSNRRRPWGPRRPCSLRRTCVRRRPWDPHRQWDPQRKGRRRPCRHKPCRRLWGRCWARARRRPCGRGTPCIRRRLWGRRRQRGPRRRRDRPCRRRRTFSRRRSWGRRRPSTTPAKPTNARRRPTLEIRPEASLTGVLGRLAVSTRASIAAGGGGRGAVGWTAMGLPSEFLTNHALSAYLRHLGGATRPAWLMVSSALLSATGGGAPQNRGAPPPISVCVWALVRSRRIRACVHMCGRALGHPHRWSSGVVPSKWRSLDGRPCCPVAALSHSGVAALMAGSFDLSVSASAALRRLAYARGWRAV